MRSKKFSAKPAVAKSVTKKNVRPSPSTLPGPIPPSRKELASPKVCLPDVQIDFAELENGSLVEVVEDPADPNQTLLAVFKGGRIRLAGRVKDRGRILVPISRTTLGFADLKLPRGIMSYTSVTRLVKSIAAFIRWAVDVPHEYVLLLAAFVLYTWVADRLLTAVYLSVIGLPQSGKSTLLELLSLLCRRALLTSDISQAAAYQACNFNPAVLIDEIDWNSSRTLGFRQMLRAGINPSARALRVHQSSSSFGPKVFGSLEASSDLALNSRCIQLIMTETNRKGLLKPGHPFMAKLASDLRQRLLKFRFDYYKSIRPALVPGAEKLRPRSGDILCSLAAPLVGNPHWTGFLLNFMKFRHDPATREPLEPRQDALLATLWEVIHQKSPLKNVRIGGKISLSSATNVILLSGGERLTVTDKGVGRMLASLGFRSTQRTKNGWILWLDSSTLERCHQLMQTYGNRYVQDCDFVQHSTTCPSCKALAAPGENANGSRAKPATISTPKK
jgi:hypothetical protein